MHQAAAIIPAVLALCFAFCAGVSASSYWTHQSLFGDEERARRAAIHAILEALAAFVSAAGAAILILTR